MPPKDLGRVLRQARQAKDWSLRRLQAESGVEFTYINKLEDGHFATPDPRKLQRLSAALEIDLEDLYALAGYATPSTLPDLPTYLRAKYDLPPEAAAEVEEHVRRLHQQRSEEDGKEVRDA